MSPLSVEYLRMVATVIAAIVALRQYLRAQAWKRLEFVAREVESFRTSAAVSRVWTMLRWNGGTVNLGWTDYNAGAIVVTADLIIHALQLPQKSILKLTATEAAIRQQFELFIEHVEHLENIMQAGLVTKTDLMPYLDNLMFALSGSGDIRSDLLDSFWEFVDAYGHDKARKLVSRFHPSLVRNVPERPNLQAVMGRVGNAI